MVRVRTSSGLSGFFFFFNVRPCLWLSVAKVPSVKVVVIPLVVFFPRCKRMSTGREEDAHMYTFKEIGY